MEFPGASWSLLGIREASCSIFWTSGASCDFLWPPVSIIINLDFPWDSNDFNDFSTIYMISFYYLNNLFVMDEVMYKLIFIGLASLTFPHILLEHLIEKI